MAVFGSIKCQRWDFNKPFRKWQIGIFYLLFVWSYAKLVLDYIGIQEFSGFEEAGLAVQPSAGWYAGQTVIRI